MRIAKGRHVYWRYAGDAGEALDLKLKLPEGFEEEARFWAPPSKFMTGPFGEYGYENCANFYPEPIFRNHTFSIENYPADIIYCDMSGDTAGRKEELLERWKY